MVTLCSSTDSDNMSNEDDLTAAGHAKVGSPRPPTVHWFNRVLPSHHAWWGGTEEDCRPCQKGLVSAPQRLSQEVGQIHVSCFYALVTYFVYVCSFVNFHVIVAIQCNHFSTVACYVSFIQDNECMFTKPKPFIYLKHYHRKTISLELPSHAKILLFC